MIRFCVGCWNAFLFGTWRERVCRTPGCPLEEPA